MDFKEVFNRLDRIETLLQTQKETLNINELAEYTGLSKSTIYKLTCSNGIPHYKKAKHLYFDKAEINNWLKSNRIKTNLDLDKEVSNYVTLKKGGVS